MRRVRRRRRRKRGDLLVLVDAIFESLERKKKIFLCFFLNWERELKR